jgi:large subunit ribosomal protein L4
MPKQARRTALCKALTMKLADGQIMVVDALAVSKPCTKEIVKIIANLGMTDMNIYLVVAQKDQNILLSARNLPNVDVIRVTDLNAYHVAACDGMVFTADAMKRLADEGEAAE